ncbi:MAG TPA: hypothetical protein VFW25_07320 [Silvibacterium sp.]|nr:hypothetical protein [Silvibacterium sp.]
MGLTGMAGTSQMTITGGKRKAVALAGLAILAALAWYTMDVGKVRILVEILLGGFAIRIALTGGRPRYDETEPPE